VGARSGVPPLPHVASTSASNRAFFPVMLHRPQGSTSQLMAQSLGEIS
jgi:hypothetical protein